MAWIHERNYENDSLVSRLVTVQAKKFIDTTNVQICNHTESRYTYLTILPKYKFYVLFSTKPKSLNLRKIVVIMQMFRFNSIYNNTYVIQSLYENVNYFNKINTLELLGKCFLSFRYSINNV